MLYSFAIWRLLWLRFGVIAVVFWLTSKALRITGGGSGKRARGDADTHIPLQDLTEKATDMDIVKTCFRHNFDPDEFLTTLPYAHIKEYHTRIEHSRGNEQVAAITVDYIEEFIDLAAPRFSLVQKCAVA